MDKKSLNVPKLNLLNSGVLVKEKLVIPLPSWPSSVQRSDKPSLLARDDNLQPSELSQSRSLLFSQGEEADKYPLQDQRYSKQAGRAELGARRVAYLRLCSLFGSDNPAESIVEAYQSIFSYFHSDEKTNKDRISKLILQLSSLKGIVPDFLEELFFSSLIGNIPIESVLSLILSIQVNKNM